MVAGFVLAMGALLDLKGPANVGWGCADSLSPLGAEFSSLKEWSRGQGQLTPVSQDCAGQQPGGVAEGRLLCLPPWLMQVFGFLLQADGASAAGRKSTASR